MNCGATDLRVLVVGYGNPLRSDDAAGWLAAERLEQTIRDPRVRIEYQHQLLPELAELASRVELVVFVDASCDGPAGTITCRAVAPAGEARSFTHDLEPSTLLGLARSVYGSSGRGMLFTVAGQSFEHGTTLSPPVEAAMSDLLQQVGDLVNGWIDAAECHDHDCGDCDHCSGKDPHA